MESESSIQAKVIKELKRRGYYVVRQYAVRAGVPDIIACSPTGKFCGFEVKNEKGKATDLQLHNLQEINKCNGVAMVIRSVNDLP